MSQLVLDEHREAPATPDARDLSPQPTSPARRNAGARLRSGQLVEILTANEIVRTLDSNGRLDGLPFMPEMIRHCGKRYRVFRRADMTCVEGHGLRRMRSTVFLQDVRCDGAAHDGCERRCLIFWKEAWLKPVDEGEASTPREDKRYHEQTNAWFDLPTKEHDRYLCQSTLLVTASEDLPRWNVTPFLTQMRDGELTTARFVSIIALALLNLLRRFSGFKEVGRLTGPKSKSTKSSLGLRPGDWVRIKSRAQIKQTLDSASRNRGLLFETEMSEYAGQPFQMDFPISRMIHEETGKMLPLANTVALKGLTCQGLCAKNCPRSNYWFWREDWLERVPLASREGQTQLGSADPWVGPERREKAHSIGRIEVYDNPTDAWPAWTDLETVARASVYQTRKWLLPWIETVGRHSGIRPMIVVAYTADGSPSALFPFGVIEHHGVRLVSFLGGCDSNANLALIHPDTTFESDDMRSLLGVAAQKCALRPDAFVLLNQPVNWEGMTNPLALLPHQRSPSECHSATLVPHAADYADLRLSADARKKLRKKRKRLSGFGPVSHFVARSPDDVLDLVDTFFTQKLARFRERHITSVFDATETRQFILRACLAGISSGDPAIELHALKAGDRTVAIYAGTAHRNRFYAMFNSFDGDADVARTSPGDLLLMSMMQTMCDRGYSAFDLGIGEARYKSSWCDRSEPLFDTLWGITLKGHAYVQVESARLLLKRQLKQRRWAMKAVQILRRSAPH